MLDIDNLMVTEADYFPISQFETESFNTAFRLDWNKNGKSITVMHY